MTERLVDIHKDCIILLDLLTFLRGRFGLALWCVSIYKTLLASSDPLLGHLDLPLDDLSGGTANSVPLLHAVLKVEDILNVVREVLRQLFPLVHR